MRIRPVKKYRPPPLPLAAWNQADPKEHAERGGRLLHMMTSLGLLGTAFFNAAGCSSRLNEVKERVGPSPELMVLGGIAEAAVPPNPTEAVEALLRIAPNLLETLAREGVGRGAFGCMAIDPPTFINEADGLAIVRRELAAAGLALADTPPPPVTTRLPRTSQKMGIIYLKLQNSITN